VNAQQERFIAAYIECAIFTGTGEDDKPLDRDYGPSDIAASSLQSMRADCLRFIREQAAILDYVESAGEHGDSYAAAGHDFWLTRNGHGAGFWDGDWEIDLPTPQYFMAAVLVSVPTAGSVLTDAAHKFGESDLYVGDDGLLYVTPEVNA
jgi:hypothetical protein